jgi:nitrogen-specific signal transduction histidine kinase
MRQKFSIELKIEVDEERAKIVLDLVRGAAQMLLTQAMLLATRFEPQVAIMGEDLFERVEYEVQDEGDIL